MLNALGGIKPFLHNNSEREVTLIIPTLQKRKLRLRGLTKVKPPDSGKAKI